ncbi:dynein regulatory complex protein 10 [Bombina bombina]|uniref:dynein regulatory complex protein 10 n=1 Tax=Bombina bombina TaxID=8345 RepID=UPI00235AF8AD|nr:dynein regulatory complex protein 10 [Bombina bombina]XP_053556526.1 dynein regulatory complex protein 10 [Bombina bombina]XP_053556527.1 dynein regulatory complex protein 10 [Bombina bombina]XP_053556528.1 dynein regulatory complex protein 10 [Bombina bombina]
MAMGVLPLTPIMVHSPLLSSESPSETSLNNQTKTGQMKTESKVSNMKMLEPGRKKLSSLETQRIVAVLDETIKKLQLVSLFQHAADSLERFSVVFGSELTGALREHKRLQGSLQLQMELLDRGKAEENKDDLTSQDEKDLAVSDTSNMRLAKIRQGIQSSVRNTLRLFITNPPASKALRSESHVLDPASQELIQILSELRGLLYEMLLTSPLEQNERIHYIQDIILHDLKNRETLAALETQLNAAILDRDSEISKKNKIIWQLKNNLRQLENISENQVKRMQEEGEKQQKAESRISESKCSKLQLELQQLRSQLNASIVEHREVEMALRKKKYKVETEIENWIKKYDSDMGEKQAELESLETLYMEEKSQLAELQEKLAVLEVEYDQIMEERRLKQLKMEEEARELANRTKAAILIQSYWRGFQVRREMKGKKKKKGKKGKGKGKKGKK